MRPHLQRHAAATVLTTTRTPLPRTSMASPIVSILVACRMSVNRCAACREIPMRRASSAGFHVLTDHLIPEQDLGRYAQRQGISVLSSFRLGGHGHSLAAVEVEADRRRQGIRRHGERVFETGSVAVPLGDVGERYDQPFAIFFQIHGIYQHTALLSYFRPLSAIARTPMSSSVPM
jgi:hypothetical protein